MPKDNAYGAWPASGEIDLVLSRGNRNYTNLDKHIGVEQFASSLHFGPFASLDLYQTALFIRNSKPGNGFNNDFHRYQMEWTPGEIEKKKTFNCSLKINLIVIFLMFRR